MKLLAHCHTYGKNRNSGADVYLQLLLEYLVTRGVDCLVVIDKCEQEYELNGVKVRSNRSMLGEAYDWCDAVIIHLVIFTAAVGIAKRFNKPIIHLAHNDRSPVSTEGYVIYNSKHLQNNAKLKLPSIVVNPPVKHPETVKDHFNEPYITLVNTCSNKGGEILLMLAKQLPQYKFLGVHGGYGRQLFAALPNLKFRPYSEAVDYSDTKILLVPSKMESWSMCAAEAMANGIPVICADLPGLRENCGDAGAYCQTLADYVFYINLLRNDAQYHIWSEHVLTRNRNSLEQLQLFYNFIAGIMGFKIITPYMLKDFAEMEKEQLEREIAKLDKEKKEIQPKKEKREIKWPPKKEKVIK